MALENSPAAQFEQNRTHLRAVAYRMLGSMSDAEDAVQEAWLRFSRADRDDVENMRAWLTTVVARVCLNMLQSRRSRREEPFDVRVPEPIVGPGPGADPEHEALLADAVGLALIVVLDTLAPAERLAFVLHDMFAVPFEEIAPIVDRTPAAARKLASRARGRVQGAEPATDRDLARQREVVNAFLEASRAGDFERLLEVLDPDVVMRSVAGTGAREVRGARAVAQGARFGGKAGLEVRAALVNGAVGVVSFRGEDPVVAVAFTVRDGRIVGINVLADAQRLRELDLTGL